MSRRLALAATAVALTTLAAAPAMAWPFGKKADPAPAAPAAGTSAAAAKPAAGKGAPAAAPVAPRKATPEERAEAERLEPLARAAFWQREADVDPQDITAGLKLSASLRAIGRNEEAATAAEHVLVLHPGNVDGLIELARSDIAADQGFYAIDPAQRAAAAAPKDWRPQSLLGVAYDQVGRIEDARAAWEQALKLSPNNPAVLSNLAMSWFATGDAAKAEPLLRTAVAQPGATLQERQNLALVIGMQGRMAEAEEILRTDLPPELASQNIAWLRAHLAAAPVAGKPAAQGHTWNSLESGNTGGN
ncbi:MAG TPA: tetratricopeptide repeat protein [Caulobacteraceae bacterium]|jgi:Flp pilus assembly protein TadD|nr:tetratricopeptide repeat protein [Caulobacteraceae bacterium]